MVEKTGKAVLKFLKVKSRMVTELLTMDAFNRKKKFFAE